MSHRSTPNPNRATAFRTGAPRKDPPGRPSVEEMQARYAAMGAASTARKNRGKAKPLTDEQVEQLRRLRPTHTLEQLREIFQRHPTTLSGYLVDIDTDFRGKWNRA